MAEGQISGRRAAHAGVDMPAGIARPAWSSLSLAAAIILALCVIGQAVPAVLRYRDILPFGDMIDVVYRYFVGPTKDFWIFHDNEHLPLFVMPIFWLDMHLFGAQGLFLILCNLLLATGIAFATVPALRRALPESLLLQAALAATFVASEIWLGNASNLVWTKQVHMYLSLFAVMMAVAMAAADRPRRIRHVAGMAAWLIVATFSFGYGIIGFPAVLAIGAARRWNWRFLIILGSVCIACLAVYLTIAAPILREHGRVILIYRDTWVECVYALTFIASPPYIILRSFLPSMVSFGIAWIMAGLGLIVFAWRAIRCFRQPPGELLAWALGLGVFTILVAAETSYARSIFGYAQAADSRYVVGQLPFWMGLFLIGATSIKPRQWRARMALSASLLLVCTGLLVSQATMLPALRVQSYNRWNSAMAAINNTADPDVFSRDQYIHPDRVPVMFAGLRARHWSAYAWPQAAWIGRTLSSFGPVQAGCLGGIDEIIPVGNQGGRRVRGWAAQSRKRLGPSWMLLADHAGTVRGLAHRGGPRPDVAANLHAPQLLYAGWIGYVPYPATPGSLDAYLLLPGHIPCAIGAARSAGSG
jgi:MFS family permease